MKQYRTVLETMKRFLVISNLKSIAPSEFTADMLMDFRHYVANECEYVMRYAYMYDRMSKHSVPQKPMEANTVIAYLKKVQAFFNELEDKDEIGASPFRSIGRKRRLATMKEQYDEPVFLLKEELRRIIDTDVPEDLQETKDCFVLQCALGCRISDIKCLSVEKIAVTSDAYHTLSKNRLLHGTFRHRIFATASSPHRRIGESEQSGETH